MAGKIESRLSELGIELPEAREPKVAKIKGSNIAGPFLFVSGQVPQWNGEMPYIGKVGREFTIEQGQAAARAEGGAQVPEFAVEQQLEALLLQRS